MLFFVAPQQIQNFHPADTAHLERLVLAALQFVTANSVVMVQKQIGFHHTVARPVAVGGTVIVQHHLTVEFHSLVQLLKLFCLSRVGFHRIQYPEIINTLQFMAQMTHLYIRAGGHVEHVPQRERLVFGEMDQLGDFLKERR